jgi:hypothetical protein
MCNLTKKRSNRKAQVRIIDQVVFGTSSVPPRGKSQSFGTLGVQEPQTLLDCHAFHLRRRARELFRGRDALQVLPQIGGQGVLPTRAFLELGETAGIGGEAEAKIMEQEGRSEREGFQRVKRIARTGDQVRHLPESVQMGDVVDGEVGQVAVNLTGEHLGPFPHVGQGVEQTLAGLGVGVRAGLGSQSPADEGVVEEVHGFCNFMASRTGQPESRPGGAEFE